MHAGASEEKNLFERLFAYTPRFGETETRTPLEDFCTEALAWCLIEFPSFRREFLELVDGILKAGGSDPVWCGVDPDAVEVSTQSSYRDDDEEDEPDAGRFDLLLSHPRSPRVAVVIESKVWSILREGQLRRYRARLKKGHYEREAVVTLMPTTERPKDADGHLPWASVQRCLENHPSQQPCAPLLRQFAAFLRNRGLHPMKLSPMTPESLHSMQAGLSIVSEFRQIIAAVEARMSVLGSRWRARMNAYQDGFQRSIVGCASSGKSPWYAVYFVVDHKLGKALLWVDVTLEGDRRDLLAGATPAVRTALEPLHKYLREGETNIYANTPDRVLNSGNTTFGFVRVLDEELDGRPEEVMKWFVTTLESAQEIAKGASAK